MRQKSGKGKIDAASELVIDRSQSRKLLTTTLPRVAVKPEWLTTQEASKRIKRGPHTLRRWELLGLIHAYRPGGGRRKLYLACDLDALILGQPVAN